MKKEKSEHKNYIDMEVYLADIKRYRETIETQKMLLDKLMEENKKLKSDLEEQEAEGGGLFDEIDYRKREAKRLGWKPNQA